MSILFWDKPKKAMPIEEWKAISADSAPPGVYVPNMSADDMNRWKAKLVGIKKGEPRVEIRKTVRGTQMLIIVGLDIRVSMNGTARMTFEEMDELHQAVQEARAKLESLERVDQVTDPKHHSGDRPEHSEDG